MLQPKKDLKFKSGNRISPLKLLSDRSKYVSFVRIPGHAGIDPVKLQPGRAKCFKDFKLPIELRNSLENILPERPKKFKELRLQLDFRREPSRFELPVRSRVCILGRQRMLFSSFPRKLFSERSSETSEDNREISNGIWPENTE